MVRPRIVVGCGHFDRTIVLDIRLGEQRVVVVASNGLDRYVHSLSRLETMGVFDFCSRLLYWTVIANFRSPFVSALKILSAVVSHPNLCSAHRVLTHPGKMRI